MPNQDKSQSGSSFRAGAAAGGAARELKPGDIVGGQYEIKGLIGRGGMGVVYRAQQLVVMRNCALKALAPERINEADWRRFQTEGKAIAKLDHLNIVKVYDLGTDGPDCLYYVMDLLDGVSLEDYIKQKTVLEIDETLEIFEQICSGLAYAHSRDLVHRDIKPSNIILCGKSGEKDRFQVKIIDFGLVKLLGDDSQLAQSQTAVGLVCGSPLYMSPEQSMGGKLDKRTDIYSLGCTLFECLTGYPPYKGETGLLTASMHQSLPIPALKDVRPDGRFPRTLEHLVNRMLQKNPAQRYQSMEQVSQDLERVRQGKSINREAARQDEKLFQVGNNVDSGQQAKKAALKISIGLLALASLVLLGWGLTALFTPPPQKHEAPEVSESPLKGVSKTTTEDAGVEKIFAGWPQISNGVVSEGGLKFRLFKFPPVPVGKLVLGETKIPARGIVRVAPEEKIMLDLTLPEGANARKYPQILAKIGKDDICSLRVPGEVSDLDPSEEAIAVSVPLLRIAATWKNLEVVDFYHANVQHDAVLAMNGLHHVKELKLHNALVDGADVAQITWLNQLRFVDVKREPNVDLVLAKLRGSKNLEYLAFDGCYPDLESLRGLARCPKLSKLSWCGEPIDDTSLAALCQIANLEELSVTLKMVTPETPLLLKKLKKLKCLDPGPLDVVSLSLIKTALPHCDVRTRESTKRHMILRDDL